MANPLKGEVELVVDGRSFTLCYSTNALAEIEGLSDGRDVGSIVAAWQQAPALGPLRLLLWGALRKHHPNLSLFDAGDILDDVGAVRMQEVGGLIGKALRFRLSGSFDEVVAGGSGGTKPE